ncbi:MAG: Altered inheritance of mitochondria protein 6 [Alectoria sarmentosa]|nr:MAG: Altered inheritance of mitochondria protein 6 [Alectoria sarmentosa]
MSINRSVSLVSTQSDSGLEGQRDPRKSRALSPDRVSAISSESETSVDNLEEGFVKKSHPRLQWLTAVVPPVFKGSQPSSTSTAFQRWKGKQRKPVPKLLSFAVTAAIAVMLVVFVPDISGAWLTSASSVLTSLLIYYIIHLRSLVPQSDIQKTIASWGLSNYPTQSVAILPADFSRDIIPIPCHSHNDYWRHVPLYDALAAGCTSVEADVWLSGNDLFVGHSQKSLTKERTLESLYIDPIISILSNENTPSHVKSLNGKSSTNTSSNAANLNGVFSTSPKTPLILLIDMKTDGPSTFPAVLSHLEPLRSRGLLTHFDGSTVVPGRITVVGTGNTPFSLLVANTTYRDIFYDAPLEELWGDDPTPVTDYDNLVTGAKYNAENSYYASVSFQEEIGKLWHGMLTPQQVLTIRGQVRGAEERGLKARYWDTPAWPVGRRDHVWDVLMREGVGALNVDDLEAAKERNWGG